MHHWALIGLLVVGCGCSAGEPSFDAGRPDAPVDYTLNGIVEVVSEGCDEWADVAHPSPAFDPPTGEAEVLWDWDPLADALILEEYARGTLQFQTGYLSTSMLALGPDGALWAKGPSPRMLVRLDRDGHTNWVRQFDFDFEVDTSSEVRIAPDGSAFMMRGPPSTLVRVRPEGERDGVLELPLLPGTEVTAGDIAIGPHGLVYVVLPDSRNNMVVATCQGERVLWRLQVRFGEERALVNRPIVRADGVLTIGVERGSRPIAVTSAGEVAWLFGGEGERLGSSSTGASPLAVSNTHLLWGTTSAEEPSSTLWVLSDDSGDRWTSEPLGGAASSVTFAPDQSFWTLSRMLDGSTRISVRTLGETRWMLAPELACTSGLSWIFDADSNLLCFNRSSLLRISAADGTVETVDDLADAGGFVNDIDGRIYRTPTLLDDRWGYVGHVVALRTHIAPPRGPYCTMNGCNRHRNNWAHDYGSP